MLLMKTKNQGKKIVRLNTFILTTVNMQSINDFDIITRDSNKLLCDTDRLGAVYVCDDVHDEIIEICFARGELNHDEFILEGWL